MFPQKLIDALVSEDVVFIIGSQFTHETGIPDWETAARQLQSQREVTESSPLSLSSAASQWMKVHQSREKLVQMFEAWYGVSDAPMTANLHRLVRFHPATYITTSYDMHLELMLNRHYGRNDYNNLDSETLFGSIDSHNRVTLFRLYQGDWTLPETGIYTAEDHARFEQQIQQFEQLNRSLHHKTLLLIGYNPASAEFRQLCVLLEELQQTFYAAYLFNATSQAVTATFIQSIQVNTLAEGQSESKMIAHALDELYNAYQEYLSGRVVQASTLKTLMLDMGYDVLDIFKPVTSPSHQAFMAPCLDKKDEQRLFIYYVYAGDVIADDIENLQQLSRQNQLSVVVITRVPTAVALNTDQASSVRCITLQQWVWSRCQVSAYLDAIIKRYDVAQDHPGQWDMMQPGHYIDLFITDPQRNQKKFGLNRYVSQWLEQVNQHPLAIIGEYGSGKSWFCQYYTYYLAKQARAKDIHTVIPLSIRLRAYSSEQPLETLLMEQFTSNGGYLPNGRSSFHQLNELGYFLFMLDGLDEASIDADQSSKLMAEIATLNDYPPSLSHLFLTTRPEYFVSDEGEKVGLSNDTVVSYQKQDFHLNRRFDRIYIDPLRQDAVQNAFQKYFGAEWRSVYDKMLVIPNVEEIFRRPALLNMLMRNWETIKNSSSLTLHRIYEEEITYQLNTRQASLPVAVEAMHGLFLEIFWHMYQRNHYTITRDSLEGLIQQHLVDDVQVTSTAVGQIIRNQPLLVRDGEYFTFVHKSFMEYFVAKYLIHSLAKPVQERIMDWKRPIKPVIMQFIVDMCTTGEHLQSLWEIIEVTRDKSYCEQHPVGSAGGNAATVLHEIGRLRFDAGGNLRDLSHTILHHANLNNVNFSQMNLSHADLSHAKLAGANLAETDLTDIVAVNANVGDVTPTDAQRTLIRAGARISRYSPNAWDENTFRDMLGGKYNDAMRYYIERARAILENKPNSFVLDVMSGKSDVILSILRQYPQLRVVLTDQDDNNSLEILTRDDFINAEAINVKYPDMSNVPYESVLHHEDETGPYDLILMKKALHEVQSQYQQELMKKLVGLLKPGGMMLIWLDGAEITSDAERAGILDLQARLKVVEDNDPDVLAKKRLQVFLNEAIDQEPAAISKFINLWVYMKDVYNGNTSEWQNRYFLSRHEIVQYLEAAGMEITDNSSKENEFYYNLSPHALNERVRKARKALENAERNFEPIEVIRDKQMALEQSKADANFPLFVEFTRKHLFKGQHRSKLGDALEATIKTTDDDERTYEFRFPVIIVEARKKL